ncbi:2-nitropropane dioxygenase [Erysipelotrichaceae bacterium MTC7]|nr:2-nitropropane dioxygenase [Erysipelotrichaceae bacterium MTC7]
MQQLKIKDKTFSFPLIQGGMGVGVSLGNLAGAVASNGCMGVISAAHPGYNLPNFRSDNLVANCQAIVDEVKKARDIALGKGLIGVNIMAASKNYVEYVRAAVKAKVDAIISGAGLPLDLPSMVDDASILLAPIVSSGKAAKLVCKIWDKRHQVAPDFVVIEGSEAGGHLGFKKEDLLENTCQSLEDIFHDVKAELKAFEEKYNRKIPVFMAGGIYDGNDIANMIKLGADGVQMGTRFIATDECDANIAFKQAIVDCQKSDIEIVQSPTGFPGRGIMNAFMKKQKERGNVTITKCLNCLTPCNPLDTPYCISEALIQSVKGNTDSGLVFIGSNAYRVNEIVSVDHLIAELKSETLQALGETK